MSARVCAILVSWNTCDQLLRALASLTATSQPLEILVIDNASSSYTHCSNCNGKSTDINTDMAYALSSNSGATSITVTRSGAGTNNWYVGMVELSLTGSSVSVDTSNNAHSEASQSTVTGVTLSPTGANDAIIQSIYVLSCCNVNSIDSGYTIMGTGHNTGSAYKLNITSGTAPIWTLSASTTEAAMSAMAFVENSARQPSRGFVF